MPNLVELARPRDGVALVTVNLQNSAGFVSFEAIDQLAARLAEAREGGARVAVLASAMQDHWYEHAWLPDLCDMIEGRPVTGDWVLYVQLQPGVKFGRHQHITPAEFFILKGELRFERGSATAGVYGYEEIGEIHEEAAGGSETEFLYFGHGPVAFIDAADKVQFIAGLEFYKRAWQGDVPASILEAK